MSKRTPKLLLEDIIESAEKILQYTKGISFEEFSKDNKTVDNRIASANAAYAATENWGHNTSLDFLHAFFLMWVFFCS